MRSNYKKLGQFIKEVNVRNKDLAVERLLGVSIRKILIPSIANTVGTDMSRYKVVRKNQFAYGPVTSRNGEKISIALLEDYNSAIISQSYKVFKIIDDNLLNPEYLMMWFRRPEFDRYARFMSHGSTRETLDWSELCETELPVPSIEKQREIVTEYNVVKNRIKLNEQLNQKLEETAQALYKHWFVDFEFPCLPSDYLPVRYAKTGSPHGQVNLKISDNELKSKIAQVCNYKRTGGLPISDGRTWFVYLILCDDNSIYKGMTNDLYRRFYEHYTAQGAKHTKQHKPVKLIHWEQFNTKEAAAKREKELKTGFGRTWINRQTEKAGGLEAIKAGSPAPESKLRTAGKMVYNEELDQEIPAGWIVGNMEKICSIEDGDRGKNYPKKAEFSDEGYCLFLNAGNVTKLGFDFSDTSYVTKEKDESLRKGKLARKDVVMTTRGTVGNIAYYSDKLDFENIRINSGMVILRNPEISFFLYTKMKSAEMRDSIINHLSGSAQPQLPITDIKRMEFPLPDSQAGLIEIFNSKVASLQNLLDDYNIQVRYLKQFQGLLLSKMAKKEARESINIF